MLQVDAIAGVAHVELLGQDQHQVRPPPPPPGAEEGAEETQVDGTASALTTDTAVDAKETPSSSLSAVGSAGSGRVFFLLKVRAALAAKSRLNHIVCALSSSGIM